MESACYWHDPSSEDVSILRQTHNLSLPRMACQALHGKWMWEWVSAFRCANSSCLKCDFKSHSAQQIIPNRNSEISRALCGLPPKPGRMFQSCQGMNCPVPREERIKLYSLTVKWKHTQGHEDLFSRTPWPFSFQSQPGNRANLMLSFLLICKVVLHSDSEGNAIQQTCVYFLNCLLV